MVTEWTYTSFFIHSKRIWGHSLGARPRDGLTSYLANRTLRMSMTTGQGKVCTVRSTYGSSSTGQGFGRRWASPESQVFCFIPPPPSAFTTPLARTPSPAVGGIAETSRACSPIGSEVGTSAHRECGDRWKQSYSAPSLLPLPMQTERHEKKGFVERAI